MTFNTFISYYYCKSYNNIVRFKSFYLQLSKTFLNISISCQSATYDTIKKFLFTRCLNYGLKITYESIRNKITTRIKRVAQKLGRYTY